MKADERQSGGREGWTIIRHLLGKWAQGGHGPDGRSVGEGALFSGNRWDIYGLFQTAYQEESGGRAGATSLSTGLTQ